MKHIFTLLAFLVIISNFSQAQNPFGNGSDGNLTVNQGETLLINTDRTTVKGVNYAGSVVILVDSTGGIQIGDEVLIITMTDPETVMAQNAVGNWETHIVTGTSSNSLIFNSGLQHSYFTVDGQKHQVVKIPNYGIVDISGTLSCPAWDGSTGGILFFRSDEQVTVQSTGIISSSGKGYRGGAQFGDSHGGGQGGESLAGLGGLGGHYSADPHGKVGAGGGGAAYNGYSGGSALAGGGGGATGGSVGLGSANMGGAGGGGGGHAGSAGGAGYGTFGYGGYSYSSSINGQNGGENFSGNGGSNGTGGGGGGGGTYGSAQLTKLFLGSGGGRGGRYSGQTPGIGGTGGGLLYISSATINCEGSIQANGGNGGNGTTYSGGGGGASGGSLYLNAISIDVSNTVTASGGNGGNGYYGNNAGNGGEGRIRLDYLNLVNTGSVTPDPYQGQFSNITHYPVSNTSNVAGPYTITAYVYDNEGDAITQTKLYYRINGGSFSQLVMSAGGDPAEFSANIPGQSINTTIEYYFTATDGTDNYTAPSGAPAELFSFEVTGFPPYGLLPEDNLDGSVNLSWYEPLDPTNFTHYSIYRSEQEGFTPGAFNKIADNINDTAYVDNSVVDFHTYYYIVSAHFNFGGTPVESFSGQANALLVNNAGQTTVLGYAFLEDQNNHANIKVKFVPQSPSAVADSIYTNALGYFETHDIFPGVYSIRLSKNGYQTPITMENMSIVQDTDLGESNLYDMGTEVSGEVSGTWSEFISVSGNITVPDGDSLIIEAGTIVRFLGNYNLFVYGYLASNGTDGNPVLFTSGPANQQQAPNQWAGIDFYNEADDNSNFQFTTVEYAYDGLYFEWSSGVVENCLFQYNSRYGMYLDRSDGSVISNSSFNSNSGTGIYMDYSTSNISVCQFLNNTSWGVQMYNYSTLFMDGCLLDNSNYGIRAQSASDLRLSNSTITNMATSGIYFYDVYERGEVTNCTFETSGDGIYLYYRSSPKISRNTFSENGNGIEVYYDCDGPISENTFVGNNIGLHFSSNSHYCNNRIFNNLIAYNTNDGIHKNGYSNTYANDPYIFNNTIFGNGGDGIQINSFGTEIIRNNIISDNGGYGINSTFYTDTCENNNIYANALGEISNLANMPSETWNFVSTNPNNSTSCDIYRNINEDPMFNLSDTLDLTLQITSKCIDGGSEYIIDPDGTISDIGAEYFDKGNPHTVAATGYGNQYVSLAWDVVENDSLVNYKVYYKQNGTPGAYTLFGNTANTSVDVTGLTNNQLYDFTVTGNYADYESTFAPPVSERPGVATMNYDPGSFSLLIPAEDDSIIDNLSVTNTGSRDLNVNFPKSATNSAYTYFDGSGDYLTYGHHDYMDGMNALTMECWLYRQNNGHFEFMGKNYRNYQLAVNSSEYLYFYKGYGNTANQSYQAWETNQYITANTWYHIALTWEGNTVKLYINGDQVWEADNAIDQPTPDQYHYAFELGRRGGENSYYLNGRIAEARLWNKVRTADEIKSHVYQSLRGDEDGLIGYWPLQEDFNDHSVYAVQAGVAGNTVLETGTRQVYSRYAVPQAAYTVAPGDTEIIPLTFYTRDDISSEYFTISLFTDDLSQAQIDLEVALQYGETVPASPVHFIPVAETGLPYTIYITDATIDGQTINVGDEIGVFDGNLCVGAGIFDGTFNFIITAWENNPGEGLTGFTAGNNMTFKMYDTSADLETNEAEETYFIGDDTFGHGVFSAVALEASVYNIQSVAFTGGQFNLVSFNLLPHYPDASVVFAGIEGLEIVYIDNGGVFIPGYNINTIGDINFLDGFYLYGNTSASIAYEGTFIHEEDWDITVEPAKWNYISMLSQTAIAVTDVFSGLEDEVSILQATSGDSWIPSQGINTIGNMQPGQGYKIALAVDTSVTFNYPAGAKKSASIPMAEQRSSSPRESAYFSPVITGLPYAVIVEIKAENESIYTLVPGDEIGLFDGGVCVGSGVYDGNNQLLITAWEQDEAQNLPGFNPGNRIHAQIYRKSQELTQPQKLINFDGSWPNYGEGNYAHVILETHPVTAKTAFFSVAPNPFKNSTEVIIELPEDDRIEVQVFDRSGRMVKVLQEESISAGYHNINWDGTDLTGQKLNPGVYFIIAKTSAKVFTEKVIILQ